MTNISISAPSSFPRIPGSRTAKRYTAAETDSNKQCREQETDLYLHSLYSPVVKDASVSGAAGLAAVAAGEPAMMGKGRAAYTHMARMHGMA